MQETDHGRRTQIKDRRWLREPLILTIKFKSPRSNNCGQAIRSASCARPKVDHIDLIAGKITGKVSPTLPDGTANPDYTKATNETAKVIASFTDYDWKVGRDGIHTIVYHIKDVKKDMYFRLRGHQPRPAVLPMKPGRPPVWARRITAARSPMPWDPNSAQKAWDDLWFYSNPIFVYVK